MNPITHALIGWSLACSASLNRRERAFVTAASVVPDFDGMGVAVDLVTRNTDHPTDFWGTYHHILGHNISCAIAFAAIAFCFSNRRWLTGGLVLASFHLHLLGDVLGARGPDGDQWPIPYLLPFTDSMQWAWSGQWSLNAWPNFLITAVLLAVTFHVAWRRGISPLEFLSQRANRIFVQALRSRFGDPLLFS